MGEGALVSSEWIDKSQLCHRAADRAGCRLLWRKIVTKGSAESPSVKRCVCERERERERERDCVCGCVCVCVRVCVCACGVCVCNIYIYICIYIYIHI
jgi:hypothetical protein